MQKILTLSTIAVLAFTSFGALAKPYEKHGKPGHHDEGKISISIPLSDRDILRDYLRRNQPHCPPGLAKKNNGCLPPGIAKKYALGKPLPPGIAAKRLPGSLLSRLHPAPGYYYAKVDQDVVLMAEATKKIVDAVTLLSAVN